MPEPHDHNRPALLVFSDDWGRHPSSCQHLVGRLLPKYQVAWVNTIGMRRPALDRVTMVRGLEKLRSWMVPNKEARAAGANPRVLNPRMWPWSRRRYQRWLNRVLLRRQVAPVARSFPVPPVAVTTVPLVADLIDHLPVARWVYYCVDDFSKWPGLENRAIREMEDVLIRRADVLIAASEKLQDGIARRGRSSLLLTHGADLDHWRCVAAGSGAPQLEGLQRPLVMFWGLIDWQMDLDFVRRLAADMDEGTIVLVGPRTDPDPTLFTIPRVAWVPRVDYEELPHLAAEASVLVMPYLDGPGLQESQPVKLKEYLATDKPAVVRDLPANRFWADALDLTRTPEEFSQAVRRRLAEGLPPDQALARQRLAGESWAEKARQFEDTVMAGLCSSADERATDDE